MNTKKPTPRNLKAVAGARLQGEAPKARLRREFGNVNLSQLLPRVQDRTGGYVNLS
jgi:hypothetical protein